MFDWFKKKDEVIPPAVTEEAKLIYHVGEESKKYGDELRAMVLAKTHVLVRRHGDSIYDDIEFSVHNNRPSVRYRAIGTDSYWHSGASYVVEFEPVPIEEYELMKKHLPEITQIVTKIGGLRIKGVTHKLVDDYLKDDSSPMNLLYYIKYWMQMSVADFIKDLRFRQELLSKTLTERSSISIDDELVRLAFATALREPKKYPVSEELTVVRVLNPDDVYMKVPLNGDRVNYSDIIVCDSNGKIFHAIRQECMFKATYLTMCEEHFGTK